MAISFNGSPHKSQRFHNNYANHLNKGAIVNKGIRQLIDAGVDDCLNLSNNININRLKIANITALWGDNFAHAGVV